MVSPSIDEQRRGCVETDDHSFHCDWFLGLLAPPGMFSIDASISVTTRFQTDWMDSDVLILVRWNCSASRLYSFFSFLMNSAECSGLSARIRRSSASKTNETSGRGRTHIRTCSNGTLCLTPQNPTIRS